MTAFHVPMRTPTLYYSLVRRVVTVLVKMLGGVRIVGAENIPAGGPVILAPNHRAHVDPPFLSLVTRRQVFFMAKEELFAVPVLKQIITGVGAFPVRRGTADRAALKHAAHLLKAGQVVLIFPEGKRSEDGALDEAEKGFALLARQTGAPVVPIAIAGTEAVLPKGAKWPRRGSVTITIGTPFTAQKIADARDGDKRDALDALGAHTMTAIAELLAQQASYTSTAAQETAVNRRLL